MVKDTKTGECYRADKLLEDHIENLLKDKSMLTSERVCMFASHAGAVCILHCFVSTVDIFRLQDRLRKIAAQADAYSPAELHEHLVALGIKGMCVGHQNWRAHI